MASSRSIDRHRPHEAALRQLSQPTVAGRAGPGAPPIAISAAPTLLEDRGEAIERTLAERSDYLQDIAATKDPPPLAFCTEVPHKLDQPFAPRA